MMKIAVGNSELNILHVCQYAIKITININMFINRVEKKY